MFDRRFLSAQWMTKCQDHLSYIEVSRVQTLHFDPKILLFRFPSFILTHSSAPYLSYVFAKLCPNTSLSFSESHILFGKNMTKHESSNIRHAFCAFCAFCEFCAFCAFCWWCASCSKLTCTNPPKTSEGPSRTRGIQRKTEGSCPRSLRLGDEVE